MALPVKLQDVDDVMEAQSDEVTAYINRKTGELAAVSDEEISYAERDDDDGFIPEWQEELVEHSKVVLAGDDYIELPDRFDIDEYSLMERFCASIEDQRLQNVLLRAIEGKGAFRRFKDRVAEAGVQEAWFAFRDEAFKRIAADFLQSEGISFVDD